MSHPAVKLGRPVVAGTRVTVDEILDALAGGTEPEALAAAFPGLTREGVLAALRYAAEAVRGKHPVEEQPPLDLHGAHVVELPGVNGDKPTPAVAVRAFLPQAVEVSIQRLPDWPQGRAWVPGVDGKAGVTEGGEGAASTAERMERIHPAGVFEALFPGESTVFPYRLTVTERTGERHSVQDPYALTPILTPADLTQFGEPADLGSERSAGLGEASYRIRQHRYLGAHLREHAGQKGVGFAVWAPNAASVSVIGDFNDWNPLFHPLRPVGATGVWEVFVPGVKAGDLYKFRIVARDGRAFDKADPYARAAELRPGTASIVVEEGQFTWSDQQWMRRRKERDALREPISIYEVHLGSWRRKADGAWLTYRELADELVPYVRELGFTHIEPMPVAEHPFDGSWGYQITGFFAPTSRYGTPDDFRYFVDQAHAAGLGVIMDWVPGHFPKDEHGLAQFDGTPLYEHADPRRSENLEWGTSSFNLDRPEVAAFLLSNALFWIEEFHVDGLRTDAVSSMIYLDYSRQHWIPNAHGGRENLEAAAFLRRLNEVVHRDHPGVLMIAEESTAWPRITGRAKPDSLGFDLKWNLGWMHDTLKYAGKDPIHRKHHHKELTFSLVYAFNEQFLLPFSHDEVVHGKRPMLGKMPGDEWQRFATLRAVYGYLYAHPGKKLLFMGDEFGPVAEWDYATELDWSLLEREPHRKLREFVRELNRFYAGNAAFYQADFGWEGFEWIDCKDAERSTLSFVRRAGKDGPFVVVAVNFTPVPRKGFRLGVPAAGVYRVALNSDDAAFGGSGVGDKGPIVAEAVAADGQGQSVAITLPPLGIVYLTVE